MVMLRILGNMGDELGVTAAVRELKRQRPEEMVRIKGGRFDPDIWLNCPYTNIGNLDDGRLLELFSFMPQTRETQNSRTVHYMKLLDLDLSKVEDEFPEFWFTAEELAQPIVVAASRDPEDARTLRLDQVITGVELDKAIAVDPGAGWPSRVWPEERFHRLCEQLRDRGYVVIQVGSQGARPLRGIRHNLVGRLKLRAVARFLGRCRLFVGNDSGYQHVSAAVGLPHVTIYSVSRYAAGPYSTTVPVMPPSECARSCFQICNRTEKGNPKTIPCIDEIPVNQVMGAVEVALARPRPVSRLVPASTAAEVHERFRRREPAMHAGG